MASSTEVQKEEKELISYVAPIKVYFNLANFFFRLGVIFSDDAQEKAESKQTQEIVEAFINALRIGKIRLIAIKAEGKPVEYALLEKYFDADALKALLIRILRDHNTPKPSQEAAEKKVSSYLADFKECIRAEPLTKDLGLAVFADLNKCFDAAIAFYSGKPASIDDCLKLKELFEKLSVAFGIPLQSHCDSEKIRVFLNQFLQRKELTKQTILECFKFLALIQRFNLEGDPQTIDQTCRGILSFTLDLINKRAVAIKRLLVFFENYDRVAQQQPLPDTHTQKASEKVAEKIS